MTLSRKPDPDSDPGGQALDAAEELPVVARMVVEIRSDGTRTVARGAIEDQLGGQRVGVEARADSPLELSRALAKMVLSAPFAALLGRAKGSSPGVRRSVGALRRRLTRAKPGDHEA
ncbi:MAG: hypothetical protein R6X02_28160 [Enhygromyxa sp.]